MNYPNLEKLIEIIATLRSENGCPWDREQTPHAQRSGAVRSCGSPDPPAPSRFGRTRTAGPPDRSFQRRAAYGRPSRRSPRSERSEYRHGGASGEF